MGSNGITKEFNRLYGNIIEVYRRIGDVDKDYPVNTCAWWFVNDLKTLMEDDRLKSKLNDEQISQILVRGRELIKTSLIDNSTKKVLSVLLKELKQMQYEMVGNIVR